MSLEIRDRLRTALAQEDWNQALNLLKQSAPNQVADAFRSLPFEQQETLFARVPLDRAAEILANLPYYDQYVLLHSRPRAEMRSIVDWMDPDARMQFFDELPEEAWQTLMDELSGAGPPEPEGESSAPAKDQAKLELPPQKATEPIIVACQVEKTFVQPDGKEIEIIAPLDLSVDSDTICALLGPSGSGKSTLLRILSGLSQPTRGSVLWHGRPLELAIPNIGMVFQSFALFPWLTVLENVEAPLIARGLDHPARHGEGVQALGLVGLKGFENAYPKELSGGMRQRVGFARALAVKPEVLFMDEPFSALDVLTAETLRRELLELWTKMQLTTRSIFMVTHNIEEAVLLADRVIVLGSHPARVRADFRVSLEQPRDRKSAEFLVYVDYIYKVMTQPELEVAPFTGIPVSQKPSFQILPTATAGGMAGILEFLNERGGKEDLYHLADELLMEVDDLFPIVDEAVLLGFAISAKGDLSITTSGKEFAESDIGTRKKLFRNAVLEHVTLIQQIRNALERKSDRAIPLELFRDILDEHLPQKDVERQIETALNWGRYAEIFTYDSETDRLLLGDAASHAHAGGSLPL